MARIRARINPTDFAHELYKLATYYNGALVNCERNNHGQHVIPLLSDKRVRQYRFHIQDRRTSRVSDRYGFLTTQMTKPILVDDLDSMVRDGTLDIPDRETVREMMSYLRNEDGSYGAAPGRFDDLVMALALSVAALKRAPEPRVTKPIRYPEASIAGTGY